LFIPPTLIINPPSDSSILKEEIFGPVMTIQPYHSNVDAIEMANSSGYGLSASIFGKNKKDIRYISKYLNVGTVSINDVLTNYGIAELPFGGYGLSGIGKVHGIEGLRAFSKQKSYMDTRINLKTEIWWYKHRENFSKYLKKWISWFYA